jgi:hypothetical protein
VDFFVLGNFFLEIIVKYFVEKIIFLIKKFEIIYEQAQCFFLHIKEIKRKIGFIWVLLDFLLGFIPWVVGNRIGLSRTIFLGILDFFWVFWKGKGLFLIGFCP